jgi:hypothetical protein
MRSTLAVVTAVLSLLGGHHPPVRKGPIALAQRGLEQARTRGDLNAQEVADYLAVLQRAGRAVSRLPDGRRETLAAVLADVSHLWRAYTRPRAFVLFSTLDENVRYLARHGVPADGTDVAGADGTVYRFFTGHGLVFHPLANFAALNGLASKGDVAGAARLSGALLARAVPRRGALVWEYDFPFGSGRAPWASGMAQAVAAQALARAGELTGDSSLVDAADAAFRAIPGPLVVRLPQGAWIKLYGFSSDLVLNAQLQAAISLEDYAEIARQPGAFALAEKLEGAAAALLPRFDTGYWSLYSLRGGESSLSYQEYVISLLRKLSLRTGDPSWRETADRFAAYETQPPLLRAGDSTPLVYPEPADGFRDEARFSFWLSKLSTVTLRAGTHRVSGEFGRGWQTISWFPGIATPGLYRPRLTAVDMAGNAATIQLNPLLVKEDAAPPEVTVRVAPPAWVSWTAVDEGTPWLSLTVRLDQGKKHRLVRLGNRPHHGVVRLRLPKGRWHATLLFENTAKKVRRVSLGVLPRR